MKKLFFLAVIAIFSSSDLLAQKIEFYTPGIVRVTKDNGEDASKKVSLVVTATPEKVAVVKNQRMVKLYILQTSSKSQWKTVRCLLPTQKVIS